MVTMLGHPLQRNSQSAISKPADNPKMPPAIVKALRASPVNKVKVAIADIDGVLRGKHLHKDRVKAARITS